nr:hypothetical protein [Sphingomonas sp.]
WSPEHQRAFIAALAITGSPRQAARHVGRAQFGADQLRTAKGGRSFAAAWDSALDLARELARLHGNLGELSRKTEEANAQAKASGRYVLADPRDGDGCEDEDSLQREAAETRERIWNKLERMRRNMLRDEIIPDPAKRAAWVVLSGPEEVEAVENGTWVGAKWQAEADDESTGCKAEAEKQPADLGERCVPGSAGGWPRTQSGENPSDGEAGRGPQLPGTESEDHSQPAQPSSTSPAPRIRSL